MSTAQAPECELAFATSEQLAALRERYTGPRPVRWSDLLMHGGPGTRDRRGMAATLANLGLCPVAFHGLHDDGRCTCGGAACPNPGAHPLLEGRGGVGLDMNELDDVLASSWRLNLGLRLGLQPNGWFLVAIEVSGTRALLEPLEAEHGALPPTLAGRVGAGNLQLFFRVALPKAPRTSVELAPGVYCRSEGELVCAPSLHPSGVFGEWLDAREPEVLL